MPRKDKAEPGHPKPGLGQSTTKLKCPNQARLGKAKRNQTKPDGTGPDQTRPDQHRTEQDSTAQKQQLAR